MKLHFLFISIFLISFITITSGQGFEKHYPTTFSIGIGPILEIDSGYIVITDRFQGGSGSHPIDLMVYKISHSGQLIDSLNIMDNDSAISYCNTATVVGNSIVAFATILDTVSGAGKGLRFSLDFNLNLTKILRFDFTNLLPIIYSVYVDSDTLFYLSGNIYIPNTDAGEPFVLMLTDSGLIRKVVIENEHTTTLARLIYLPNKNEFRLISNRSIWYYSKDLESDSLIRFPLESTLVSSMESVKLLNDTTLISVGFQYMFSNSGNIISLDVGFVKQSINAEVKGIYQFGAVDTSDQVSPHSIDFLNSDSIYVGCMSNPGNVLWSTGVIGDAWVSLYNISSNGTINWHKNFGTNAEYLFPELISTKDHGCLIACERWDWQVLGSYFKSDLYLIKTDRFGNSSALGISDNINPEKEIIYDDYINNSLVVKVSQPCLMRLYDLTGRLVFENNLNRGFNRNSTNLLKKGVYIYSLYTNKMPPISGKVIIQ